MFNMTGSVAQVILKSWIILICVNNTLCMHDYYVALMQTMCWQKLWNLNMLSQIVSVTLQYKEKYFLSAGTQKFKAPFNISF